MPEREIPQGHQALPQRDEAPRIADVDVPIEALDVPIRDLACRHLTEHGTRSTEAT